MGKGRLVHGIRKILGKDEATKLMNRVLNIDGGPGSGNFGHKGRPGKVGGSGPGGGKQYRGGRSDIGYYGSRKDWLNGLQGERQHEAARFISAAKKLHGARMETKKKIESLWERGLLTREEVDRDLKEAHLDTIREDMTPEQFIMKECSEQDREQLLGMMKEARSWDDTKDRLKNENLSDDEKKVLEYLTGNTNFSREKMREAFQIRQQLEAKAMGMDLPVEIPDEIQYEAGTKERPAPPKPKIPQTLDENNAWIDSLPQEKQEYLLGITRGLGVNPQAFGGDIAMNYAENRMMSMVGNGEERHSGSTEDIST